MVGLLQPMIFARAKGYAGAPTDLGPDFISRANKRLIVLMQKRATTDASSAHIVPPEQKGDIPALQRVLTALKGAAEPPVAAQQGPRNGGDVAVASMLQLAEHAEHAKAIPSPAGASILSSPCVFGC